MILTTITGDFMTNVDEQTDYGICSTMTKMCSKIGRRESLIAEQIKLT